MPLDPSIILSGQPLNLLGAIQSGNQLAAQANEIRRGNALADLYRTQGQGLMSGDPAALNALAAYDPQAAMQMKAGQQETAFGAEKMQMLRTEAAQRAADHAASLTEAQRKETAAKIEQGVAAGMAAKSPQEWDALMQQFGAPDLVGQFANRQAIAYSYMGVADAMKAAMPEAPQWRAATPEEAAGYGASGGQLNTTSGEFKPINPPAGTVIESDGHGGMKITQGVNAKAVAQAEKAAMQAEQAKVAADVVTGKITEAKGLVTNADGWLPTTGFAGQKMMNTGGTAANDLRATLNTIKANVAFDKLQQMRASSPTGGALGAVSDREMELLSSALASLDQTQSAEQLLTNLNNLESIYKTITDKLNAPTANSAGGTPAPQGSQSAAPPGFEDIWNKY